MQNARIQRIFGIRGRDRSVLGLGLLAVAVIMYDSDVAPESVASAPLTARATVAAVPLAAAASGRFSGRVLLDGPAPELPPLIRAGQENVKDKEVCGAADIPDESLLVGEDNGIRNVFVFLRRAPRGYKAKKPEAAVVLDQKGCIFLPHTALIRAGQQVLIKSSDPIQHNVHTFPARNQSTNLLIKPNDQQGIELVYRRPESGPIQVKCDIHSWMSSWHLVLDHPFMAVTDETGAFSVDDLPTGRYQFRVWHERAGLLEKSLKVTVKGDDKPVTLKYPAAKFSDAG